MSERDNMIHDMAGTFVCMICNSCLLGECVDREDTIKTVISATKILARRMKANLSRTPVMDIPAPSKVKPGKEYPIKSVEEKA